MSGVGSRPVLVGAEAAAPAQTDEAALRPPPMQFKVELDDRAILLPDGKIVQHLIIYEERPGRIALDGVFAFNRMQRSPRILALSLDDAGSFTAELVAAVYAAKTSFMFSAALRITITVVANGYRLEIQDNGETSELFLSTAVIWRFIKSMLAMIDAASPPLAS